MILVDAGPLVALVNADEAIDLLGDLHKAQEALLEILARGVLRLLPLDVADVPTMRELMSKYADLNFS